MSKFAGGSEIGSPIPPRARSPLMLCIEGFLLSSNPRVPKTPASVRPMSSTYIPTERPEVRQLNREIGTSAEARGEAPQSLHEAVLDPLDSHACQEPAPAR